MEFAWLALGTLSRRCRRELIAVGGSVVLRALQERNRNAAAVGCGCLVSRMSKLTRTEWEAMSDAAIEAVRSDVLPEMARRNMALSLLDLPDRVGRLNRELARKAATDVFPDLVEST